MYSKEIDLRKDADWRVWNRNIDPERTLLQRATGELPEMECTKQLVDLVSEVYQPNMKILDVGCATGHYLLGLLRIDKNDMNILSEYSFKDLRQTGGGGANQTLLVLGSNDPINTITSVLKKITTALPYS